MVKIVSRNKIFFKCAFVSLDCLFAISDSFPKSGVQSLRACYYNINNVIHLYTCVLTLAYSMTSSSFLPGIIGYIYGYYPEAMAYFPG